MLIKDIDNDFDLTDFIIEFDGYHHIIKYRCYTLFIFPTWRILTEIVDNEERDIIFNTKQEAINFINHLN